MARRIIQEPPTLRSTGIFAVLKRIEHDGSKAGIVRKIQKVIDQRRLTQEQAGAIIGLPQGKLSKLLRGRWESDYTVDRLTRYLNKLGVSVVYSFHDEPDWHEGHLRVVGL